jgi:hypothetical protein
VTWSRILSLLVAVGYLITATIALGGLEPRLLMVVGVLLPPVALIWFPEHFGNYIGPVRDGYIDQKSPPFLVSFMGWFFLIGLPLILFWLNRRDPL